MTRYERAMHDLQLQRAIQWISDRLLQEPQGDRTAMIDQASQEFGLSPKQEEFLYHLYSPGPRRGTPSRFSRRGNPR